MSYTSEHRWRKSAMLSSVTILGKIQNKPVLNHTKAERVPVMTLHLSTARDGKNGHNSVECTLWRGLAEKMAESVVEGDLVWIEGTFKSVSYKDHEDNSVQKIKVKVDRAFKVPLDWLSEVTRGH